MLVSAPSASMDTGFSFLGATSEWVIAFDANPSLGALAIDLNGKIVYHNRAALEMYGDDDSASYRGMNLNELFHPLFASEYLQWNRHSLARARTLQVDQVIQGRRIRLTINPLPASGPHSMASAAGSSLPMVLVLCRHAFEIAAVNPQDVEVVYTRFIDLGPLSVLTARELEVLAVLGQGMSVPEAAVEMQISPKTLEKHKTRIGRKLGTSGADRIVRRVTQLGLRPSDTKLIPIQARNRIDS